MADENLTNGPQPGGTDDSSGIGGLPLVDPNYPIRDTKLLLRAIRNEWPVPAHYRRGIIDELYAQVLTAEKPETRIVAARAVISADAVNAKRESDAIKAESPPPIALQVNLNVVRQALQEPGYLEYLERRALEEDRDASIVRPDGGPVQDGPTPDPNLASPGPSE